MVSHAQLRRVTCSRVLAVPPALGPAAACARATRAPASARCTYWCAPLLMRLRAGPPAQRTTRQATAPRNCTPAQPNHAGPPDCRPSLLCLLPSHWSCSASSSPPGRGHPVRGHPRAAPAARQLAGRDPRQRVPVGPGASRRPCNHRECAVAAAAFLSSACGPLGPSFCALHPPSPLALVPLPSRPPQ
jgi:hypothetical protein